MTCVYIYVYSCVCMYAHSTQERLVEEQKRKGDMVAAMNRYRDDKIASLEARKQSALLNQQEEE